MTARVLFTLALLSSTALAQTYPSPTYQGLTLQADPATASQAVRKGYLDQRLAVVVNAADDGMKCDGVTNDTAALNAAIARSRSSSAYAGKVNYGMHIQLPMGRCVVSGVAIALAGNQSLDLSGYGSDATELMFTTDTDGIAVTLDGAGAWLRDNYPGTSGASVRISDLGLVRTLGSEGRTAITVTSTATQNPGAKQVTLKNITLRGVTGNSAWQNGVSLFNTTGTLVEDLYFHAPHATNVGTGTAISYGSSTTFISTEHHITRANVQGAATCYRFAGMVQGVTIDHSSCVGAVIGLVATSLDGTNDSLLITSSHFDALQGAVQTSGWNNVSVVNNYLLANSPTSINNWIGFSITQGARNSFTGNHVFGRPGSTGQSLVKVTNDTGLDSQVSASAVGNSAEYMTGPMVILAGSTANAQVVGNLCLTCGSLGTDARGLGTTWAANTINGRTIAQGLDGTIRVGAGATQSLLAADATGALTVTAPSTIVSGALLPANGNLLGVGSAANRWTGNFSTINLSGQVQLSADGASVLYWDPSASKIRFGYNGGQVMSVDTSGNLQVAGALVSPTITGISAAPTAAVDTSSTQLATTAFVLGQAASSAPTMPGTAAAGTSTRFARADHVHPTDTSRAPLVSPALTGTPTAPTAAGGTSTTQLATTAFVAAALPPVTAPSFQIMNTSGTFVPAAGATWVRFRLFGPGGAGGAGVTCAAGASCSGGGGGGPGGMTEFWLPTARIQGGGCTVTIGTAGSSNTVVTCNTGLVKTAYRGGAGATGATGAAAGGGGGGGNVGAGAAASGASTGLSNPFPNTSTSGSPITVSWGGTAAANGACGRGADNNLGPTGGGGGSGLNAGAAQGVSLCGGGENPMSAAGAPIVSDTGCEPNVGGASGVASTAAASTAGGAGGLPSGGGGGGGSGSVSGGAGGSGGAGRVCIWQG